MSRKCIYMSYIRICILCFCVGTNYMLPHQGIVTNFNSLVIWDKIENNLEFESGTSLRNNYDLFDKGELGNSPRKNRRCVKMNSPAYSFTSISFVTNISTGVIKYL